MLLHCLLILAAAGVALANPGAPPTAACDTISPNPVSHGAQPQSGNGGYVIATNLVLDTDMMVYNYTAGQTYDVQVRNLDETMPLRGFFVQARDPSNAQIGSFTPSGSMQGLVNCPGGAEATIGHMNDARADFFPETFTWTAPSGGDGFVNFQFAVVRMRATYYANQNAAEIAARLASPPMVVEPGTVATPEPSMPGVLPATVTMPDRNPEDYRITARTPENCRPTECELFVGIDTNAGDGEWLDVHIQGNAGTWVAVGFSASNNMFSSDVLGCNVNPNTGMVDVLDTWNPASGRANDADADADSDARGVGAFSTSVDNGRITCTFARLTAGTNVGVDDLNLDASLFLMYGIGSAAAQMRSFSTHRTATGFNGGNPIRPGVMVNPAQDTMAFGGTGPLTTRERLTRAHGILMLIAWPVLGVLAIFFAAWMRPALPNGEWFQVHRAFMLGSLFVGAAGFLLIFVAQYENGGLISLGAGFGARTAHFVIGILIMLFHIVNPIIAIFRCHPGTPNRWIFNLVHGTFIGLFVEVLALTNVGIGIAIFSQSFSTFLNLTIFWVYLGWVVFFVAVIAALFIIFSVLSCTSQDDDRAKLAPSVVKPLLSGGGDKQASKDKQQGVELAVPGGTSSEPAEDKPKVPSGDSPLRWAALAVFAGITIPVMVILLILIAI